MNAGEPTLSLFWFRRDLRLNDNAGLYHALKSSSPVLPIFIFDKEILNQFKSPNDLRVNFIYEQLCQLKCDLNTLGSDLRVYYGNVDEIFTQILKNKNIKTIFTNNDYEPSALKRDQKIAALAKTHEVSFKSFKDQCLFEKNEICKKDGKPYIIYTPYKKAVLQKLNAFYLKSFPNKKYFKNFLKVKSKSKMIRLEEMGYKKIKYVYPNKEMSAKTLRNYSQQRDFPFLNATSHLGLHLRFGTISIRKLVRMAKSKSETWLSELIWRDFFMQILFHFPYVENKSFRKEYDNISWRNSSKDFIKWCEGKTGYPLVDAGMRELNQTGYMHNRVRMVVASFLCKHLLIHWSKGERYFAEKLLDYDLSANNGNWQWCAGSGCDAAPYFRIFNPQTQLIKFDKNLEYVKKWIPEYDIKTYIKPIIDHNEARYRCLKEYAKVLKDKGA